MHEELLLVKYSFDGKTFIADFIPTNDYAAFKQSFMENSVFYIKKRKPQGESPFIDDCCNEKYIDMSKVVAIGF